MQKSGAVAFQVQTLFCASMNLRSSDAAQNRTPGNKGAHPAAAIVKKPQTYSPFVQLFSFGGSPCPLSGGRLFVYDIKYVLTLKC
jgi:hypothetical protein